MPEIFSEKMSVNETLLEKKSLEVINLKRSFGSFTVSLDLSVEAGETLALVGPSGSGKTTALNLISGLTLQDSGKIIIDGEDVSALPPWKRNISLVFQDLALFPHLDVAGNIGYGLFIRGVSRIEREKIINEKLKMVRLPGFGSRHIHTLSGGERQRVALARSLASSPKALLLDEPFSSLDLPLRKEMRREFLEIRSYSKAPCIFVTHDREEAVMLGDKIALMDRGCIVEIGSGRELFLTPKTEFAGRFFGAGHVLPASVLGSNGASGQMFFVPHDAIYINKPNNADAKLKSVKARFCGSSFIGTDNVLNFVLDCGYESIGKSNEECLLEVKTNIRFKEPPSGSNITLWIDQNFVSFLKK